MHTHTHMYTHKKQETDIYTYERNAAEIELNEIF